jgi:hypothetical protein
MGHLERFPPGGVSGRCQIGQGTSAGAYSGDGLAPTAAIREPTIHIAWFATQSHLETRSARPSDAGWNERVQRQDAGAPYRPLSPSPITNFKG